MQTLEEFAKVSLECLIEKKCTKNEIKILEDDLWAVRQLDAFGRFPSAGFLELGLFDIGSATECNLVSGVKYDTHFCYMKSDVGKPYENGTCKAGLLKHAVCMPKSCSEQDLVILMNLHSTHLLTTYCGATCAGEQHSQKNAFFWITSVFFMLVVAIMLLASFIDYYLQNLHSDAPVVVKNKDMILVIVEVKKKWSNLIYTNAFFSVDTFFVLSGIVVSYLFFKNATRRNIKKPTTWILYYVHRYWRLTPAMMLFIVFIIAYENYLDGPWAVVWSTEFDLKPNQELCQKYWWQNLLYINNFRSTQCYGLFWYLACDFQMYIVAPIFLVALFFSFPIGSILLLVALAGSVATTTVLYLKYHLGATELDIQTSQTRCPPYLFGIFTGYLIAKKLKRNMKMHPVLIIIGWALATAMALAAIFSLQPHNANSKNWSYLGRSVYQNLSRIGWSIAICWVVVANHLGWGGPINEFMSHPIWQPLGRLSYSAYIVHYLTIIWFENLQDRPTHYVSMVQMILYYALPVTCCAYFFAFFWSCAFEVSMIKIEKIALSALLPNHGKAGGKLENSKKVDGPEIEETTATKRHIEKL